MLKPIMKFLDSLGLVGIVLMILLIPVFAFGWVLNIIDLIQMVGGPADALFILRVVGIPFSILGAILGLFF